MPNIICSNNIKLNNNKQQTHFRFMFLIINRVLLGFRFWFNSVSNMKYEFDINSLIIAKHIARKMR